MKKCRFCPEMLADEETVCPVCGKQQEEPREETPAEETVPAEEAVTGEAVPAAEETPASETAAEPATEEAAELPAVKKATPGKIALAVAAVVVLAAALIGMIVSGSKGAGEDAAAAVPSEAVTEPAETVSATVPADGNPENVTCKGTYTVSDEEALAARETVVATIGDRELTNGKLQTYYWSMVNNYLSSEYGYYMMMYGMLDYTKPLDTQICFEDQSLTWQQYFLREALNYWQLCTGLAAEAQETGTQLSQEDREYLDNLPATLEQTAASYSMTLDALIRNNIGPGGTLEDFIAFQDLYLHGKDYYQNKLAEMEPTMEELEAFYETHAASYEENGVTKDARYVDVRHILFQVEGGTTAEDGTTTHTQEEWDACKAKAQEALDTWMAGEKTEESFAALANQVSQDPGSNTNGGLYENVYKGQMVEPFENWCFDEARAYGDSGLVQTSYGYHVMFYVGSEPVWISYAENDCITERSNSFLAELAAKYPLDVTYENITLGYINLGG